MKLNTVVDDAKAIITDLPYVTKRFLRNSWAGYLSRGPNPRDAAVFAKYWIMNWAAILYWIGQSIFKLGPIGFVRALYHNPWILILLRVNGLATRLLQGRSGMYHDSVCLVVHTVCLGVIDQLRNMLNDPERLVIFEDLVPYDIGRAMGLNCYLLELMGIVLPILYTDASLQYIDEAENSGMNPDACSLPKATVGMVIKGHMPKGVAMVSSNMPCDAGAAS
ncbi:MAG: hypothetical protein QMD11_06790, partial [Smithella sp.]|nr:hypothetical protein [Smithella sp.]